MKRTRLPRRRFLLGAGGFALTIPVLPSLMGEEPAQAEAPEKLRFVCVASQFGRDQDQWVNHPNLELGGDGSFRVGRLSDIGGDAISPIFGPRYQGLRAKLAIASGLDLMGFTDGHNDNIVLTGGTSGPKDPSAFGESIDNVLAGSTKVYPDLPMTDVLRASPSKGGHLSVSSKFAHCQVLPTLTEAHEIYNRLFDPASVAASAERNRRLERVTHLAYEDYQRTAGSRQISALDRVRLDNYMDILSDIEGKIGRIPAIQCGEISDGFRPEQPNTAEALHDLFFDLEVAALTCGITKLVTHSIFHVESNPTKLGGPDYHGAAHNHSNVVGGGRKFVDYNRWTMDVVASFLQKLDAVVEADGNTLLDNTLFYFSSSDATGSHTHYDMPVVLAGAKGVIRGDTYVDYRRHEIDGTRLGRPYNNLLVSILKAFGLEESEYQVFRDQVGFGEYSDGMRRYGDYYHPWVQPAARNEVLPVLFV